MSRDELKQNFIGMCVYGVYSDGHFLCTRCPDSISVIGILVFDKRIENDFSLLYDQFFNARECSRADFDKRLIKTMKNIQEAADEREDGKANPLKKFIRKKKGVAA